MDRVIFGNHQLSAIIALTEDEQQKGLMKHPWPPPVMAFPYDSARVRKFWMKDTPSPLDIVFCRAGRVLKILPGEPLCLTHVGPDLPSDLIVELPRGMAHNLDIVPGTKTKIVYGLFTLARKIEIKLLKNY